MTRPELERFLERFELVAPVTMDDIAAIRDTVKPELHAGATLDVMLRGNTPHDPTPLRVEVLVGGGGPAPCSLYIPVAGGDAPVRGVVAMLAARAV